MVVLLQAYPDRIPVDLQPSSGSASTVADKANLLNCYFALHFSDSLKPNSLVSPSHPNGISLSSVTCTQQEVYNLLATNKTNTATGPDSISSQMICATADAITPTITAIFNQSLKEIKVPDDWR